MKKDLITNMGSYAFVTPAMLDFIKNFNPDTTPGGRHEFGNGIWANVDRCETRSSEDGYAETHERFVDIQWMTKGAEIIEVCPRQGLTVRDAYSEERDITFYENGNHPVEEVELTEGTMVFLYPEEAHKPLIHLGKPSSNVKVVFKIPVGII